MKLHRRPLRLAAPMLGFVLSLLLVGPAQAQGLHTLTGETLLAFEGNGTSQAIGVCNPSGTSTYSFTISGQASGPYPGTFTETGTLTLGPFVTEPDGNIVAPPISLESTFTITSEMETITGSKTLSSEPQPLFNYGACGEILTPFGFPPTVNAVAVQAPVDYTAEIVIGNGNAKFLDTGTAIVDYGDLGVRDTPFLPFRFFEFNFVSDLQAPTPIVPIVLS